MKIKSLLLVMMAMLTGACSNVETAPIKATWEVLENGVKPNYYSTRFVITNVGDKPLEGEWALYYNHFSRGVELVGEDTAMVTLSQPKPSYYKIMTNDRYAPLAVGDSMVVDINTRGSYINACYGVDGGHYVDFKAETPKALAVEIIKPLMNNPKQWTGSWRPAPYPDGDLVYELNSDIFPDGATYKGGFYDILPSPKDIKAGNSPELSLDNGVSVKGDALAANYLNEKLAENKISTKGGKVEISIEVDSEISAESEYYSLKIGDSKIEIIGATAAGALNGAKTLIAAIERNSTTTLPAVTITDYPDMDYRGMMLDISRNFTTVENSKRLIDVLASYKLNYFHFHFSDDESWRLEIPGLPELTDVGSKRGWTEDESEFLFPTFTGTGSADDNSTANGFYTRDEFIDMLRYADSRGVKVIPEIEGPGHARAAIIAMKARYNKLKDSDMEGAMKYKIWDENDSSKYLSAQNFTDNVLDVSSEGTYNLINTVADEIIKMYAEAEVVFPAIHIGGDEVPRGSWRGSPNIDKLKEREGLESAHEVGAYFINRVAKMLDEKGVKTSGWQEVAMNHSAEENRTLSPMIDGIYVWQTIGTGDTIPYSVANNGYGVVLCNVDNFYLDMSYNSHQYEPGLNWGGYVDEFATWRAQPYNLYRSNRDKLSSEIKKGKPELTEQGRKNILGVQAQLFSETIRNFEMVEYYNFPKIFGMVERGWNATPEWGDIYTDNELFNSERAEYNLMVGTVELPRLDKKGINFQLGQPGIKVIDGMIYANAKYPNVIIRYTTDGSEPNENSAQWSEPVTYDETIEMIKAKAYYLNKESKTTYWIKK
ncbi:MAG: family 20 glycosylhydrolase [Bacteroidales bacterium]